MNSPHEGQGRGALMFSLICAWTNNWANNGYADDLRRHRTHYDVTVMCKSHIDFFSKKRTYVSKVFNELQTTWNKTALVVNWLLHINHNQVQCFISGPQLPSLPQNEKWLKSRTIPNDLWRPEKHWHSLFTNETFHRTLLSSDGL